MNRMLSLGQATLAVVTLSLVGHSLPVSASEPVPFKGRAALTPTGAIPIGDDLQLSAAADGCRHTPGSVHADRNVARRSVRRLPGGNNDVHGSQWRRTLRRRGGRLHCGRPVSGRGLVHSSRAEPVGFKTPRAALSSSQSPVRRVMTSLSTGRFSIRLARMRV